MMVSNVFSYVLLVSIATTCLGQQDDVEEDPGMYVGAMPDPMKRYGACGRNAPSMVCDPDNLLPLGIANEIDDKLFKIYNDTSVPCYTADPSASKIKGYLVMLAVVPKMQKFFTKDTPDDNIFTRYREGRVFAYHLGRNELWGKHSTCSEMVVILYSKADNVLVTITQPTARRVLTDDIVNTVAWKMVITFYPFGATDRRAASAINFVVDEYSRVLTKGEK